MAIKSVENLSRWDEYPVRSWRRVSHEITAVVHPFGYQKTHADHTPNSTSHKVLTASNDDIAQRGVLLHAAKNVGESGAEASPGLRPLSGLPVHLSGKLHNIISARGGVLRLVSQCAKFGFLGIR